MISIRKLNPPFASLFLAVFDPLAYDRLVAPTLLVVARFEPPPRLFFGETDIYRLRLLEQL